MLTDIKLASEKRNEELLQETLDNRLDLLLANYQRVTANPRSMGYLRFLLRHYAKAEHPWRACYRDNFKRFGPKTAALCVSFDTPVNTSKGLYHISELKAGDEVWSYNGKDFVLSEVLWSGCTGNDLEVIRIEIEDDKEILITPEHRLLKYNEEWVEGKELNVGDYLLAPLSPSIVSSVLSRTFFAKSVSFSNSCFSDSSITFPKMSSRTSDIALSLASLNNLMVDNNFFDFFLSAKRHPGVNYASYGDSHISMNSPIESFLSSQVETCDIADSKNVLNFVEGPDRVLSSSYQGNGLPVGLRVPSETSLTLQEASSPSNVCGRQITDVVPLKKGIDVWDIMVADTHNFVVHDFIIAHNCGVLKDTIRQGTHWRGKNNPHDAGAPGVAIGYADAKAAPPWGGHKHLSETNLDMGEMAMPEEICLILEDISKQCNPYRVLIGLDEPPVPSFELEGLLL